VFAGGLKNGIEHLSNLLGSAFPSDFLNLQFEKVFRAPLSPSVEVKHLGKARRENLGDRDQCANEAQYPRAHAQKPGSGFCVLATGSAPSPTFPPRHSRTP